MATRTPDVDLSQELVTEFGENATYVSELLGRYRANPDSVDEDWRAFFRERLGEPAGGGAAAAAASAPRRPPAAFAPGPATPRPPRAAPPAPAVAPARRAAPYAVESGERSPLRGAALRIAENM